MSNPIREAEQACSAIMRAISDSADAIERAAIRACESEACDPQGSDLCRALLDLALSMRAPDAAHVADAFDRRTSVRNIERTYLVRGVLA